jgi:hypothetical protein
MEKENLIKVFAGSGSSAILIKSRLKEIGIESMIKNDSSDAFLGTAPQVVDLYINKPNLKKARPIIQNVVKNK